MNEMNKLCLVFLFSMCVIYSIEAVAIKEFKMSLINSFKINDTFDLECNYELESNETLVNIELKLEETDLLRFNETTQKVQPVEGGQFTPALDTNNHLLTAKATHATGQMAKKYLCKIEGNGQNKTAEEPLEIYLWDEKNTKIDEFYINTAREQSSFEFNKGQTFTITCKVTGNSTIVEYNINICHDKSVFFTYEFHNNKHYYVKNSKISENDFEYVENKNNETQLKIQTKSFENNMKGEYSCSLELKKDLKRYLEFSHPLDVKGAGNINKISLSIILTTLFSLFYSMFK